MVKTEAYVDVREDDTSYVENSMQDRRLWRSIINARQQESTE